MSDGKRVVRFFKTGIYASWFHMKQRCNNPNAPDYSYYGGRGITYDPAWESFKGFSRDMAPTPYGKTLGRINNNKGYSKENCRWESREEQARNKRTYATNMFGIGGVSYCIQTNRFRARAQAGGVRHALYTGPDFFEACCARKSWENRQ